MKYEIGDVITFQNRDYRVVDIDPCNCEYLLYNDETEAEFWVYYLEVE